MMSRLFVAVLSLPIRAYRAWISPLLPASCRFHPSCSSYALEALQQHGPLRGPWLAFRRLARCHPFHRGGIDPVPAPHHSGRGLGRRAG